MIGPFTVLGQVTRDQNELNVLSRNVIDRGIEDGFALGEHLRVLRDVGFKRGARRPQMRIEDVEIRKDCESRHLVFRPTGHPTRVGRQDIEPQQNEQQAADSPANACVAL
jgi:hypothetical protein